MNTMTLLAAWTVSGFCLGAEPAATESEPYPDPARFEQAVAAFESADQKEAPPTGAVLCIGSSSMRGWHETLDEDLAPLTVIPRGFGGSTMHDVLFFADRIILPYAPRAILLYEGDNDAAAGVSPEKIDETFAALVEKVHAKYPKTRFYVLPAKPSIRRWNLWPKMQAANALIARRCKADDRLTFIDISRAMLDKTTGRPNPGIFLKDKLHMNAAGYVLWRDAVRPVLVEAERGFEEKSLGSGI